MGRAARALLITLITLALLAVGADRLVKSFAEREVVTALTQSAQGAEVSGVQMQIHGFPFLTQVLAGRLNEVTGSMDSGTFGGLTVTDLHLAASGVQSSEPFHVEHAEANALIPYATLQTLLNQQLAGVVADVAVQAGAPGTNVANPGTLAVSGLAFGIDLGLDAAPAVVPPRTVRIDIDRVVIAGAPVDVDALPFGIGGQLRNMTFNLDLPAGLSLDSVSVEPGGLRAYVVANDVSLATIIDH